MHFFSNTVAMSRQVSRLGIILHAQKGRERFAIQHEAAVLHFSAKRLQHSTEKEAMNLVYGLRPGVAAALKHY